MDDEKSFMFPRKSIQLKDISVLMAVVPQREIMDYFEQAEDCGVDMFELQANMYIYNRYAFDLSTLIPYTQVLSGLIFLFRTEFDEYIYKISNIFKYSEAVQNQIMDKNIFANVFNDINNILNLAISSDSTFTYYIYDIDGVCQISAILYSGFISSFNRNMNDIIDDNITKYNIIRDLSSTTNMIMFYESIYEIFESMRVPFY